MITISQIDKNQLLLTAKAGDESYDANVASALLEISETLNSYGLYSTARPPKIKLISDNQLLIDTKKPKATAKAYETLIYGLPLPFKQAVKLDLYL